ncbi:MAG: hypothetical protein ACK4ND_17375, partial [Cytophagaceae bacterium]
GGNISWRSKSQNLHIGTTTAATMFSLPVVASSAPYRAMEFTGNYNVTSGIDARWLWKNFNFFGEYGRSLNGRQGLVSGLIASLSPQWEMATVIRNYSPDFHSFYGRAFGENYRSINEKGMYWGVAYKPSKYLSFRAYYDRFKFPWMKYLVHGPSEGQEYLLRADFRPNKQLAMFLQYREETKDRNLHIPTGNINFPSAVNRQNFLANIDYYSGRIIHLRSRVQFSKYDQENYHTYGYAIIQDFDVNLSKVRFNSRFALFDTEDYNNRQYVFEKNVLYSFSLPAYYGRGIRTYLMTIFRIWRKTDVSFRYARTIFQDRTVISSGNEQIEGNRRTDITVQMLCRF